MNEQMIISPEVKYWLVRPGINGLCFDSFKRDSVIAIGWDRIGKIDENEALMSIEKVKHLVSQQYSDLLEKKASQREYRRKVTDIASKIYRFTYELKKGDYVVCPGDNSVLIGTVCGDVRIVDGKYDSGNEIDDGYIGELNKVRDVKWIKEIDKSNLEPNIKLELRVIQGLSQINKEQVITEINRSIYNLYSYNNKTHSVFRIKNEKEIDFFKYANFIECVNNVYKKVNSENEQLYIKTNINSPGPIEFIGKTQRVVVTFTKIVDIVLNNKSIPEELQGEHWIEDMQEQYTGYNYDDYEFPSGGQA